jgi:hypothetical protein
MNQSFYLLLVLVTLTSSGCFTGWRSGEGFVMEPKEARDETWHTLRQLQNEQYEPKYRK